MRDYADAKQRYERTKPIRGRDEDVRPIGERRRTHEQINKRVQLTGEVSYCATLYGTDVIEYHNNGDITLRTGGWATPSTAEFMHAWGPVSAWKQDNKLWARMATRDGMKVYPINDKLTIRKVDNAPGMGNCYEPVGEVTIMKRVVDREKANAARAPLKPFLGWSKAFLKMSDGWLRHDTRKEVIKFEKFERGSYPVFHYEITENNWLGLYNAISNADPDDYMKLLCHVLRGQMQSEHDTIAETFGYVVHVERYRQPGPMTFTHRYYDSQYSVEKLHKLVYGLADKTQDIHRLIEVEPTNKAIRNTK